MSAETKMANRAYILANLHLHAVLPRLEELVKLDDEAQSIARQMKLNVRFKVRNGPSEVVNISDGVVRARSDPQAKADLGLFFVSCDQLNNMFMEKLAVPIPYKGVTQLRHMMRFSKLTEILTRYLKPAEADLSSPGFKKKHVEMTLMVGLAGAAEIAKYDQKMEKVVDRLPWGTLQFSVLPDGPYAYVSVDKAKNITVCNGTIEDPTANLDINGADMAAGVLAGTVDTFAALGSEDVRATGLLPLVDEFNALLDRVGFYLA
jgi:hypothetical protein